MNAKNTKNLVAVNCEICPMSMMKPAASPLVLFKIEVSVSCFQCTMACSALHRHSSHSYKLSALRCYNNFDRHKLKEPCTTSQNHILQKFPKLLSPVAL